MVLFKDSSVCRQAWIPDISAVIHCCPICEQEQFKTKLNFIFHVKITTPSPFSSPETAHLIYLELIQFTDTLISAMRQESNQTK